MRDSPQLYRNMSDSQSTRTHVGLSKAQKIIPTSVHHEFPSRLAKCRAIHHHILQHSCSLQRDLASCESIPPFHGLEKSAAVRPHTVLLLTEGHVAFALRRLGCAESLVIKVHISPRVCYDVIHLRHSESNIQPPSFLKVNKHRTQSTPASQSE